MGWDRHGRGLRGRLVPPQAVVAGRTVRVPLWRTRSQQFDELVRDAVQALEPRFAVEPAAVEFAVEDVPPELPGHEGVVADETAGGAVPLGRLLSDGDVPRVVVYRRPLEARAGDRLDLAELVQEVVVEQVARLLALDPDDVDPA